MAVRTLPQPATFPTPAEVVTQTQLARILQLKGEIAEAKKQLEQAEGEVQHALERDVPIESGLLKALLKVVERRSVPWKKVVERELGEDYATRVLASTKPDRFTHLVVTA